MTDKKISELTNITGANVDDANDELAIVDASATETKAITRAELFSSVAAIDVSGNITVSGTVDGRDVAADGSKLDGIESGATADQTAGEIKTAYESNADTNAFTDSEKSKLSGIDQGVATTDSPSFAGLTVDTDTLYVDSTNNRVGIGTTSPAEALEVVGDLQVGSGNDFGIVHLGDTPDETSIVGRGPLHATLPDTIEFRLGGASPMFIDNNGRVGIGTALPDQSLHINHTGTSGLKISSNGTTGYTLESDQDGNQGGPYVWENGVDGANGDIYWSIGGSEAMRIDSSGNVGIGTNSPSNPLDVVGTGSTLGSFTRTDGQVSLIRFEGSDTVTAPLIGGFTDDFYINTGGSEAMRIDSSGNLLVGKTSTSFSTVGFEARSTGEAGVCASGTAPLYSARNANDGNIVIFLQDGSIEGTISVSGSTISYNGGHLSRWSRLPDGTDDTHIYKGTVMTNLDEMCEWRDEEGDLEDNEQLNKTTVSSEEGDPNVAGLFVAWDEDDDWGDYYLAMTGDLVVRIAQGVTVQRGDLLMSAGDGTAKPQGDDIVRSKTVAKVTSTHVSHTYPDGSYAVPCVVMAS